MEKQQRIVAAANRAVTDTIQSDAAEINERTPLGTSLSTYTTNNETTVNEDDNEGSAKPRPTLSTADRFAMRMSNYDST